LIPVEIQDDVRRLQVMLGDTPLRAPDVKATRPAARPEVVIETYVITERGEMRVESGSRKG
jgi:hypothetical protein